jgi:hypothetical protein
VSDWTISHPKARWPHLCDMCRRVIDAGEVYKRGAGFDGTAWSWKECTNCEAVLRIYGLGDIHDGYNPDHFEDWASDGGPRDLNEARDMAGFRQQWRTKAGNLWPLPGVKPELSTPASHPPSPATGADNRTTTHTTPDTGAGDEGESA